MEDHSNVMDHAFKYVILSKLFHYNVIECSFLFADTLNLHKHLYHHFNTRMISKFILHLSLLAPMSCFSNYFGKDGFSLSPICFYSILLSYSIIF